MTVIKISILSLLLVVYSVSSNDSENLQKFKYKFNHPPLSESYQSIPVAIVYDEPGSDYLKLAGKPTTYHPELKLDTVTEANKLDEKSSIDYGDFPEEEHRRVKELRNLLRKARLRLRANISSDVIAESTATLQADLDNTSVTVNEFETTEKSIVYKEIDRSKPKEQTVSLSVANGESINEYLTPANVEPNYPKTVESETRKRISNHQEEALPTVKMIDETEPQPINRGRQRGQRVRPRAQTEVPPSIGIDESSFTTPKNEQPDRKTTKGRGSIKYRNYELYSTVTTEKNTKIIPTFTIEDEEEKYPKNTSNLNKSVSEQSLSPPERENYPSSEQPKLTNNRPGPRDKKPWIQNIVTTTNTEEKNPNRVLTRGYSEEETNPVLHRGQQRFRYVSQSASNAVGTDTKIKSSSILDPENYPTSQKPKFNEKIPIEHTKEGNYLKSLTTPLQLKTNERITTRMPIITTTEEENYPKLPIVPLQKLLKTNEQSTTLRSLTTIYDENPQLSVLSQTNDTVTLHPASTAEDINYSELDVNETTTIQPTVTTEEENYPDIFKPLNQYKGEVTNVQLGSIAQESIIPSTPSLQNVYQQRKHEDVQVGNKMSVPNDIDGRVITLKSSFDVATTSPLLKSLFKQNNKVKVIYKVQNADTPSEVTDVITTRPSMTEEMVFTSGTVKTNEEPFVDENEFVPQQPGSKDHSQDPNVTNLPSDIAEEIISASKTVKATEKPFINENDFKSLLGTSRAQSPNEINVPSTTEELIATFETIETTEKPFVDENDLKLEQLGDRSHSQNQKATNVPSTTEKIIYKSETVKETEKTFVNENQFMPQQPGSMNHFQDQNLPSNIAEELISTSETIKSTEKPLIDEHYLKPKQLGDRSHFQTKIATNVPSTTEKIIYTSESAKETEKSFVNEIEFKTQQFGGRSRSLNRNAMNVPSSTENLISTSESIKTTEKPFKNKNELKNQHFRTTSSSQSKNKINVPPSIEEVNATEKPSLKENEFMTLQFGGRRRSQNQNEINVPSTTEKLIATSETVKTTKKPFIAEHYLKPELLGDRSHFQNQIATNVPSTTEEIISTSENVNATEKPFVNGNEFKPQQNGSRSRFQNNNGLQIPVVIVYDNTDASLPGNQRKIVRTKSEPANNSFNARKKPVETVNDFHESPKIGNVTENLNAEKRTRARKPVVPILNSENHIYAQTGKFNYRYESGDGTNAFQEGVLRPFDDDVTGEAVKGGFSYTDEDGNDFSLSYTADENGYRPVGKHLPTPPPIPPAIARALAHLATKSSPDPDEVTESSIDE